MPESGKRCSGPIEGGLAAKTVEIMDPATETPMIT